MSTACSLLAGNDLRAGCTPFGKVDKSHVTGLFWVENSILMANVMSDRLLEVDNINVQVQCVKRTRAAGRQVGNDMTFVHFSSLKLSSGRRRLQRRKVDKSHVNDVSADGCDLLAGCNRIGEVIKHHVMCRFPVGQLQADGKGQLPAESGQT